MTVTNTASSSSYNHRAVNGISQIGHEGHTICLSYCLDEHMISKNKRYNIVSILIQIYSM